MSSRALHATGRTRRETKSDSPDFESSLGGCRRLVRRSFTFGATLSLLSSFAAELARFQYFERQPRPNQCAACLGLGCRGLEITLRTRPPRFAYGPV